jgi:hypothetical protein
MNLHPASAPAQPKTAPRLLRLLGVEHESAEDQRPVMADWLERNTATAELKTSLRANGYGRLLSPPRLPVPRKITAGASTALS